MSKPRVLNFIAFQVAWLVAVAGAAAGYPAVGPVAVALWIGVFMRRYPTAQKDLPVLLAAALIGVLVDSTLVWVGAMSFAEAAGPGYPTTPWMVALWINFAASLRHSLHWICGRYVLGFALGAIGGPLAYFAGAKMGALVIQSPLAVIVAWSIAMPLLLWIEQWAKRKESRSVQVDASMLDKAKVEEA